MESLKVSRQRLKARRRRVLRLVSLIEEIQNAGYLGREEATSRQIFPGDYIELLLEVDKRDRNFQNYFHEGLRYEYRESRYGSNQFTVFILSAFHRSMQRLVDTEVGVWSSQVKNSDNAVQVKTAAGRIRATGEAYVPSFTSGKEFIRPDCSFDYIGGRSYHPPVVFEIAWSQSTENLKKRAIELIQGSTGEIRTVVALDFSETYKIWSTIRDQVGTEELPSRGPAKAFIWRAMFDENGEQLFNADGQPSVQKKNYIFCDNDGNARPRAKLQLSLRDFIPLPVLKTENWDGLEVLSDTKLEFDSAKMVGYFDEALAAQKKEDEYMKPRKEMVAREKTKVKQEREAKKRAAAEKERGQRSILDMVNIGGHSLHRRARLN